MVKVCSVCNKKTEHIEMHHIIPKSRGGNSNESNLIALCSSCHGLAHDVSFSKDRGGLVKEGVLKRKKNDEEAEKWLGKNEELVSKKMHELYLEDENKWEVMLFLLNKGSFTASKIKEWFDFGEVTIKTSIKL